MEYTAQVMGQDNETSDSILSKIRGMSRDAAVDETLKAVTNLYNFVQKVIGQGAALFDTSNVGLLVDISNTANATVEALNTVYGDTQFSTVYPTQWASITSKMEQISKWYQTIYTWNPAAADVRAEFMTERKAAMANGDLDSPYVGPGLKSATIAVAFGRGSTDAAYATIRDRYLPSGDLRAPTGQERVYTPAERMMFIKQYYEERGVEAPAAVVAATPGSPADTTAKPGIGKTLAILAAAAAAYFALR